MVGEIWGSPNNVTISTKTEGAPISKYIYGQFIEHLGRGVYGGLWAEMLEDRKFYFVVKDRYAPWGTTDDPNWDSGPFDYLRASPWRVVGPTGTVSMDTEGAFVGIHSPSIRVTGQTNPVGLAQEGLALEYGRAYSGHLSLRGDPGVAVVVRLTDGQGQMADFWVGAPSRYFQTMSFTFTSPVSNNNGMIEILGTGTGTFEIGDVSLMPQDAVRGWRADVLALLKELDAPIYRWPGGNFVSGYNWRDGIGDRDKRPPRQNPAWRGVESNDVGLQEFMDLMDLIGSEPYVTLNTGLGSVEEATQEVEYCIGSIDTPLGRLRADQGHPAPFPVHWWALGNEMFGSWQLGHMPVETYSTKHNQLAQAIRKIDPHAGLVGVGAVGPWDLAMLSGSADFIDLISEHIYRKQLADVDLHSQQLAADIDRIAQTHRSYRDSLPALGGENIRIAMDEWNYWYGPYRYGELGVQYHLRDALGVARGLHAFFRNSDLYYMANYAQTVNVLGAIKASKTRATLDTTGLVLSLYRHRFGSLPLPCTVTEGNLDVSAALTDDHRALTVAIVNPGPVSEDLVVQVDSENFTKKAVAWVLTGVNPECINEPGREPEVTVRENRMVVPVRSITIPPYSITIVRME
jgi:alpha-N-arabinofuranosidase